MHSQVCERLCNLTYPGITPFLTVTFFVPVGELAGRDFQPGQSQCVPRWCQQPARGTRMLLLLFLPLFVCCAQAGSVGKQSVGKEGEAEL